MVSFPARDEKGSWSGREPKRPSTCAHSAPKPHPFPGLNSRLLCGEGEAWPRSAGAPGPSSHSSTSGMGPSQGSSEGASTQLAPREPRSWTCHPSTLGCFSSKLLQAGQGRGLGSGHLEGPELWPSPPPPPRWDGVFWLTGGQAGRSLGAWGCDVIPALGCALGGLSICSRCP